MKRILISFCFLISVLSLLAQNQPKKKSERDEKKEERRQKIDNLIRQQEEGALVFNKQNVFGLKLNTNGYSLFYEKAYLKSVTTATIFSIDFSEIKHPKEKRLNNVLSGNGFFQVGSPYVYGKQNSFYQLKPFIGQQRMLGGKTNKNGVAIHAIYGGGISIGLERPYYVKVNDPGPSESKDIKYTLQDSAAFLSPGNIVMGTGLRYGWKEIKFVPGLHAKAALRFDYGRFNEMVSAIEIGLNAEVYSRKINIMLLNPNKQFFFNGYIALILGKRK